MVGEYIRISQGQMGRYTELCTSVSTLSLTHNGKGSYAITQTEWLALDQVFAYTRKDYMTSRQLCG